MFPKEEKVMHKSLRDCARFRELQVLPWGWRAECKAEEQEKGPGRVAHNARGEPGSRQGSLDLILRITRPGGEVTWYDSIFLFPASSVMER